MTRRHLRIYVAGPIQGANLLESLANIENGLQWQTKLFQLGFSPFPVFSDYNFIMKLRPVPPIGDVYNYSLAWLRVADAMLVLPGSESSKGVAQERKEAERLAIPVFDDVIALCSWADCKLNAGQVTEYMEQVLARSDD